MNADLCLEIEALLQDTSASEEAYRQLLARLLERLSIPSWRPVSELPTDSAWYVVRTSANKCRPWLAYFRSSDGEWDWIYKPIVEWAPLPARGV